jgi:enoyl-CoA hydratase/carnithine racemase
VGIALEMELTGEPINAQRALAANMVSKVVPHDDLRMEPPHSPTEKSAVCCPLYVVRTFWTS